MCLLYFSCLLVSSLSSSLVPVVFRNTFPIPLLDPFFSIPTNPYFLCQYSSINFHYLEFLLLISSACLSLTSSFLHNSSFLCFHLIAFQLFFLFLYLIHSLILSSTLTSLPSCPLSPLDPLLWAVVPRKDPNPGPALGGAGETPQKAAGQVWQWAAALLRSHVLCAQCVPAGTRGHQVKSLHTPRTKPKAQHRMCALGCCCVLVLQQITCTVTTFWFMCCNHSAALCCDMYVYVWMYAPLQTWIATS